MKKNSACKEIIKSKDKRQIEKKAVYNTYPTEFISLI